jgi:hypothetical protein
MTNLNEIIASAGLLLTLTTFLFNLAWPKLEYSKNFDTSISGPAARRAGRRQLKQTFFCVALPLLAGYAGLFYINFPTTVKIICSGTFDLWNFSVSHVLFVFVEFAIMCFVILNFCIAWEIFLKIRALK